MATKKRELLWSVIPEVINQLEHNKSIVEFEIDRGRAPDLRTLEFSYQPTEGVSHEDAAANFRFLSDGAITTLKLKVVLIARSDRTLTFILGALTDNMIQEVERTLQREFPWLADTLVGAQIDPVRRVGTLYMQRTTYEMLDAAGRIT